jgi:phage terminase small subunit
MSEKKLTPKQAAFVSEYVKDYNGKQAAIRAGFSQRTAEQQASRLLRNVKVKSALVELQKQAQERNEITVDDIIRELDENRNIALSALTPQAAAATAATIAKAKMLGLMVEKTETNHSGTITQEVREAPKLTKEEWLKSHGLGTAAGSAK